MSEFGEPRCYAYKSHHVIDTKLFDIPFPEKYIIIIEFDIVSDVADPKIEPILVYSYAGMRRYLWRNIYWGEVDLPVDTMLERVGELLAACRDKHEAVRLRQLADVIHVVQNSPAPHPDDTKELMLSPMQKMINAAFPNFNFNDTRAKKWCRAIYKINQR